MNPFTDFGFKKLFGSEPNKDILISFLNEILPEKHRITDLTYAKNEQTGLREDSRNAIFDLFCTSRSGEQFIVEMQKAKQNYFRDRSVFYTSFPIQEQAQKGEWNYKLEAVYLIGILDFTFSEDAAEKQVRHEIQLKDQQCRVFYDKLTYIYLEMPHFNKREEDLETNFDKWMYVLRQLPNLQERPRALQERVFARLFEAAEIAHFNREDRLGYEASLKTYRDLKNVVDTSFDEGKAEGLEEGLEKGEAIGLEKGATRRSLEIALQMKKLGEPVEKIILLTGLERDVIEKL
ncbi:MAG: Rpn family recombination-promoting nuclease/putative transposase [Pseudomonadota bacterium]